MPFQNVIQFLPGEDGREAALGAGKMKKFLCPIIRKEALAGDGRDDLVEFECRIWSGHEALSPAFFRRSFSSLKNDA
jgi:hypothetical protein